MAEGLLRHPAGDRFEVFSAGARPTQVRPEAIAVMHEIEIYISGHRSIAVDRFLGQAFAYVITVCGNARDACPAFPGAARRLHWSFEYLAAVEGTEEARLAAFRAIREHIRERVLNTFALQSRVSSNH